MEQDWRCSDHWSPPQWVHFVSWFQQHQWFLQANVGVEIAPKKPPFETETKSFQLLVNSYLPSCCFQTDRFHISRQILFGEFEFSPTPETVSVAFGIKEDDPVKEWGSTNAENKANYGGASAWNLKKPAMQQDDGTVGWLVGWLGPGASHRQGPTCTVWGQSCMGRGNSSLILVGENFMMMFFSSHLQFTPGNSLIWNPTCCHKVHGKKPRPSRQRMSELRSKQPSLCLLKLDRKQW